MAVDLRAWRLQQEITERWRRAALSVDVSPRTGAKTHVLPSGQVAALIPPHVVLRWTEIRGDDAAARFRRRSCTMLRAVRISSRFLRRYAGVTDARVELADAWMRRGVAETLALILAGTSPAPQSAGRRHQKEEGHHGKED